jgi:hypothetical protein
MALSLEEQMRIAAGYSEQEGSPEPEQHEVVQPAPVQQTTVTTEYVKPEPIKIEEEVKVEQKVTNDSNTKEIIINALKVYERYSELTESEKSVVIQFVNAEPSNDVPTIIEKVISVDSHKRESLINFVAILQKDEVKRAFRLMSFNQNQLESLDEIASRFILDYKQIPYSENKKIEYAENLNDNLRKLPEKALTLLERLEEVLNY